jgi:hypothetical protein
VDIRMRIGGDIGTIASKSFIDESINFYSFQPANASWWVFSGRFG